jgi:RNA polymerase sigma-70 factor (ECF subfamily)
MTPPLDRLHTTALDDPDLSVTTIWREHHGYLINVAYRMLASCTDAEDMVQEAFARLLRSDRESIDDVRGWLVVVVSRLCLDQLRSARVRREAYIGPWLPEPVIPAGDTLGPEDRVTLDDTVGMAMLVVLERLSPLERVAFILHDIFEYPFDDIGRIMKRTPVACRQLASRGRQRVVREGAATRGVINPVEAQRITERFLAAASTGDLDALLGVLDPEAVGWTDSGGLVPAPRHPVVGSQKVAVGLLGWLRSASASLIPIPVNAGPGAVVIREGEVVAVLALTVEGRRIAAIRCIANPEKLSYVRAVLGGRRGPSTDARQRGAVGGS